MNALDYVSVNNVIPTDLCNSIISNLSNSPNWQKHEWYNVGHNETFSRDEHELDVIWDAELEKLNQYIFQAVDSYHKSMGFDKGQITHWGKIRLNKYGKGSTMATHTDLIRRNQDDGVPVLSIVGALNDNYGGGEFVMFEDTVIPLKQGDILIFPSGIPYEHKVNEITEGERYSFVTWGY